MENSDEQSVRIVAATKIKRDWQSLKEQEPTLRARDIANKLGISEGELVAARVGDNVIRLKPDSFADLFEYMPEVGRVMILTRNESCVHEKKGWFEGIHLGKSMGAIVGGAIDLRVFLTHFKHGFNVIEESRGRVLESLQFFDGDGVAVHKIYRQENTNEDAWHLLVERFAAKDQTPGMSVYAVMDPLPHVLDDADVDTQSLQDGWRNMGYGPHEIYNLLKNHQVTRLQSLRLVGGEFAKKAGNDTAELILHEVANIGLPIMVFVGSPGLVQIHSGIVRNIKASGNWINVLDEDFNLHLRLDHVVETWVVKKPTKDGFVTSVELYGAAGEQIAQFFGERLPGRPEISAWTRLADSMVSPKAIAA